MIFKVWRASDWKKDWEVDLQTLQDLLDLVRKEGQVIVQEDNTIVIYDDYME